MLRKNWFSSLLFLSMLLSFQVNSFGQQLPPFFQHKPAYYTLFNIREFYDSHYKTMRFADSMAQQHSQLLKKKNKHIYLMNELGRVQLLSIGGDKKKALRLLYSFKNNKTIKHSNILSGYYYNVYGNILFSLQKPLDARLRYQQALSKLKLTKDSVGIKGNYINIANSFCATNDLDSALVYFQNAIELKNRGIYEFDNALKSNLAKYYQLTNELDKSVVIYEELIALLEQKGDSYGQIIASLNLGDVYKSQHKYNQAIALMMKVKQVCNTSQLQQYIHSADYTLSYCYAAKGDYQKSYSFLLNAYQLRGKEMNNQNREFAEKLKNHYQFELFKKEQKINKQQLDQEKYYQLSLKVALGIVVVFLFLIVYFNRKIQLKNRLLVKKNVELTRQLPLTRKKKTEAKTILPELIEEFERLLQEKKVFVDQDLSLEKIAKLLNSNRTYLSETINQYYNEPFRNIINSYRINEARLMLVDKGFEHYSIEGVALSVGYRSISSFNAAFKKETGVTPSYFRREQSLHSKVF